MEKSPQSTRLRRSLQRCLRFCEPWSGVICRATGIEYANRRDLLTGEGAKKHGGRWTPPQFCAAVHAALDPHTALAETLGTRSHYGIPFAESMPLVLVAIDATLQSVLDLTDGQVRKVLGVSEKRLIGMDWREVQDAGQEALTQTIGRLAFEVGIEALLVPSARLRHATNVVIFPEGLRPESTLSIQKIERLPEPR